jgi:hypothetical protein
MGISSLGLKSGNSCKMEVSILGKLHSHLCYPLCLLALGLYNLRELGISYSSYILKAILDSLLNSHLDNMNKPKFTLTSVPFGVATLYWYVFFQTFFLCID